MTMYTYIIDLNLKILFNNSSLVLKINFIDKITIFKVKIAYWFLVNFRLTGANLVEDVSIQIVHLWQFYPVTFNF